jgi:hypothetical protein
MEETTMPSASAKLPQAFVFSTGSRRFAARARFAGILVRLARPQ